MRDTDSRLRLRPVILPALLGLLLVLAACGGPQADTDEEASGAQPEQVQIGDVLSQMAENFREGTDTPPDWPGDLIPIPPGAEQLASLENTTLPGQHEVSAVFYSTTLSGDQIRAFYEQELPPRGWEVLEAITDEELASVSAQGHGRLLVVEGGALPRTIRLEGGATVSLQLALTKAP